MSELLVSPSEVVRGARGYLDTPFHHQGRNRAGMDCAGLIARVAWDLGLSEYDLRDYGPVPNGDRMRAVLREQLEELPPGSALELGLVALLRFEKDPQHLAFVADYLHGGWSLVHALQAAGRVTEHRLNQLWRNRIVALYRLPGVGYKGRA